jgi:hypothetical protein
VLLLSCLGCNVFMLMSNMVLFILLLCIYYDMLSCFVLVNIGLLSHVVLMMFCLMSYL